MRNKQFITTLAVTSIVVLLAAGCSSTGKSSSLRREQLTIEQAFTMKTNKGQKSSMSRGSPSGLGETELAAVEQNRYAATSSLTQQMNGSMMSTDRKVTLVAAQVDQITTTNVNHTMGGKLPSYLYHSGFNMDIDFIYWRTDTEGVAFATLVNDNIAAVAGSSGVSSLHQVTIGGSFDPGFRLQFGYTFANIDKWDMEFDWTYFHNTDHQSESVTGLTTSTAATAGQSWIQPNFGIPNTPKYGSSVSGQWRLNYNTLDWELGRNFFISRQISTRMHWGIRAAWLYQHYSASYTGFNATASTGAVTTGTFTASNNYHAVGLRTGTSMRWGFNRYWAFVGNIAFSLLYGRFQISEFTASNVTAGSINEVGAPYNFNAVRPEIEASLGLEWCAFFCHDKYRFSIAALWEIQEWFEQNMLNPIYQPSVGTGISDTAPWYPVNSRLNGNLGIQGFTLKFRFDF